MSTVLRDRRATGPVSPLRQAGALCRAELRAELRTGEVLWVTMPFGAVALLLAPLALGSDRPLLAQLGAGMYWLVVLLFGVLVTLRQSAADAPEQVAVVRLLGVPAAARLGARAAANTVLLAGFELTLLPVLVVLYQPRLPGAGWLLALVPLVAASLGVLGTVACAVASGLAGRASITPLLVCPVAVPLLLASSQTFQATGYGRSPGPWLLLLTTLTLALWLAMLVLAPSLEDLA